MPGSGRWSSATTRARPGCGPGLLRHATRQKGARARDVLRQAFQIGHIDRDGNPMEPGLDLPRPSDVSDSRPALITAERRGNQHRRCVIQGCMDLDEVWERCRESNQGRVSSRIEGGVSDRHDRVRGNISTRRRPARRNVTTPETFELTAISRAGRRSSHHGSLSGGCQLSSTILVGISTVRTEFAEPT